MSPNTQTILRNIVFILILELVMLPFGIFVYLQVGFHIYHVALAMGYLFGIIKIVETANLLLKHVRIVNDQEVQQSQNESFYE